MRVCRWRRNASMVCSTSDFVGQDKIGQPIAERGRAPNAEARANTVRAQPPRGRPCTTCTCRADLHIQRLRLVCLSRQMQSIEDAWPALAIAVGRSPTSVLSQTFPAALAPRTMWHRR